MLTVSSLFYAPTPLGFAAWLVQELVALRGLSPDARCRAEGRYYGRSNRCYDLYNKLKRFLLCHGFVRLLG